MRQINIDSSVGAALATRNAQIAHLRGKLQNLQSRHDELKDRYKDAQGQADYWRSKYESLAEDKEISGEHHGTQDGSSSEDS